MRPTKRIEDSLAWFIGTITNQEGLDAFDSFFDAGMVVGLSNNDQRRLTNMSEVIVTRIKNLGGVAE